MKYHRWSWLMDRRRLARTTPMEIPPLPPQGETEITCEILPVRRGFLRLVGQTLSLRDPTGLFQRTFAIPCEQSIPILPRLHPIPPLALPGRLKYQAGGVALANSVGESEEFLALRDYRPGDSIRHVHWKSVARTGKLVVREYEDEFFVRQALILDTFHPIEDDAFEDAVSVAASLAMGVASQDSLLDLMFVGPQAYCFTAGRGVAPVEKMLEILASVSPARPSSFDNLQNLVLGHASSLSGAFCILLKWDAPRIKLVQTLQGLRVPVHVFLILPSGSPEKPDPGPLRDSPEFFHILESGRIPDGLSRLK